MDLPQEEFHRKIVKVTHGWVISRVVQAYITPRAEPDLWGDRNW